MHGVGLVIVDLVGDPIPARGTHPMGSRGYMRKDMTDTLNPFARLDRASLLLMANLVAGWMSAHNFRPSIQVVCGDSHDLPQWSMHPQQGQDFPRRERSDGKVDTPWSVYKVVIQVLDGDGHYSPSIGIHLGCEGRMRDVGQLPWPGNQLRKPPRHSRYTDGAV